MLNAHLNSVREAAEVDNPSSSACEGLRSATNNTAQRSIRGSPIRSRCDSNTLSKVHQRGRRRERWRSEKRGAPREQHGCEDLAAQCRNGAVAVWLAVWGAFEYRVDALDSAALESGSMHSPRARGCGLPERLSYRFNNGDHGGERNQKAVAGRRSCQKPARDLTVRRVTKTRGLRKQ